MNAVFESYPAPWMTFFSLVPREVNSTNPDFPREVLDVYCGTTNFGEILLWSPLMNATPTRLTLLDTETNRRVAPLLDGLGLVRFASSLPYNTENFLPYRGTFFPKRILKTFGLGHYSCLPRIKLFPSELAEAHQIISYYHNPICIRDIQAQPTGDRDAPENFFQRIVDANPDHTFLSFGLSSNHPGAMAVSRLKNVIKIDDLPPRLMAACYYWVGKWVGPDCGPSYLMLAVGGKCDIWCPPLHNPQKYVPFWNWYPEEEWGMGEAQRINYLRFDDCEARSIIGLKYP